MHTCNNYVSINASYESNAIINVIRNTDTHNFTYLTYAPEQICLSHNTDMSNCTTTVVYIRAHISAKRSPNKQQSITDIPHIIPRYVPKTNMHPKCHIHLLVHVHIWDNCGYMSQLCKWSGTHPDHRLQASAGTDKAWWSLLSGTPIFLGWEHSLDGCPSKWMW